MKIVYYKLPDKHENVIVSTVEEAFVESEVALLFDHTDEVYRRRYEVTCQEGIISAVEVDDNEEYMFFAEDEDNFTCVIPHDSVDNAITCGRLIHRELRMHEQYYDRLEDV